MLLFSTDIDGTIYDGPETAALFADFWGQMEGPTILAYNTGRALDDARQLIEAVGLPRPDFLICGVGTTIYDVAGNETLDAYHIQIGQDWDFDVVHEVVAALTAARPQPPECQNANKCSWFWEDASPDVIDAVIEEIARRGVKAQAVYSSNIDLDFLPLGANKGNALRWLAEHLGVDLEKVVVAGDSGNDSRMYGVPGVRGIVVSNSEPTLVDAVRQFDPFFATLPCAHGVVEGLRSLRGDGQAADRVESGTTCGG